MKDTTKKKLEEAGVDFREQVVALFSAIAADKEQSAAKGREQVEKLKAAGVTGMRLDRLRGMVDAYSEFSGELAAMGEKVAELLGDGPPWVAWLAEMADEVDAFATSMKDQGERQAVSMESIARSLCHSRLGDKG